MKLKLVETVRGGGPSLAVWHLDRWVVLKTLLGHFSDDQSPDCRALERVSADLIAFLQERDVVSGKLFELIEQARQAGLETGGAGHDLMPFKPLLYRDFMLCEAHVIGGTRGFAKRIFPPSAALARLWEGLTHTTFPPFRPKKAWYKNPVYYKGNHLSFQGDGAEIVFPDYATWKDYELELGMIITREIFNATEDQARSAIGAFCIFNDFSVRNVQVEEMYGVGFGPAKSKDFASSLSAVVVTADELWPKLTSLETRVFINDQLIATGRLDGFYHSLQKAVAYASRGERVYPGEFMATGTIPNCCGMENGHLLEDGDLIRLEIDGIGSLSNRIRCSLA